VGGDPPRVPNPSRPLGVEEGDDQELDDFSRALAEALATAEARRDPSVTDLVRIEEEGGGNWREGRESPMAPRETVRWWRG